jgi:DNA-binding PadR family transcriptional regulator
MHAYAIRQELLEFSDHIAVKVPRSTMLRRLNRLMVTHFIEGSPSSYYWLHRRVGVVYEITEAGRLRLETEMLKYLKMLRLYRQWLQEYEVFQLRKYYPRYKIRAAHVLRPDEPG